MKGVHSLFCKLFETGALIGIEDAEDLIFARRFPVIQLGLKVLMITGVIVQYGLELLTLLRRQVQFFREIRVGKNRLILERVILEPGTPMNPVIKTGAHHNGAGDRAAKKNNK